jgi:hypothetical protein
MKKLILVAAVASLTMVSCKKDRACSCKQVVTLSGGGQSQQFVEDYDMTLTDASYRTAFRACTHTKDVVTDGGFTYEIDTNCELK